MKSFNQYIKEEFELYGVKNLEVVFDCNPKDKFIEFEVPDTYSEDNFQIYLQDRYLKELPGDEKRAEQFFGKNKKYIFDVFFLYNKYDKSEEQKSDHPIEFIEGYDTRDDSPKFVYVRVEDLRYIIKFETFEYKCEDVNDTKDILVDIFKTCESNTINKFPIDIVLNEDEMKYI